MRNLDALKDVEHPDIDRLMLGLENGKLAEVASSMGNVLEGVNIG